MLFVAALLSQSFSPSVVPRSGAGAVSAPAFAPLVASRAGAGAISATIDGHFAVGVLAVQGGFAEHMAAIERQSGVVGREVRVPSDLEGIDALILPGGESTTQGHCMMEAHLLEPVRAFAKSKPVWGVCAGMILLADGLAQDAPQALVGGLHATVERNAFGRQVDSRFRAMALSGSAAEAGVAAASYFIRAPAFAKVGEGVEVLATLPDGNKPVAVRQDNLLATCFHPEISGDDSWLHFFLNHVAKAGVDTTASAPYPDAAITAPWSPNPMPDSGVDVAVKRAFAVFQKGGVIMDVVNGEQARIAEEAGAVAVMALERIPADIKRDGGVARSSDPAMIKDVMAHTSLPVMAKARIGHFYEARVSCDSGSGFVSPPGPPHLAQARPPHRPMGRLSLGVLPSPPCLLLVAAIAATGFPVWPPVTAYPPLHPNRAPAM
eukprot:scaffold10908_cov105-Isochrysis_galbana.AAC.2